jgi:hypothetical protein
MSRRLLLAFIFLLPSPLLAADPVSTTVRPLLQEHCLGCHSGDRVRGGIDLAGGKDEASLLQQPKLWRNVLDQLRDGTMPPFPRKPLTPEQKEQLVTALLSVLDRPETRPPEQRDPGPSLVRRLTRSQYDRTLRDLLALDQNIAEAVGLPEEQAPTGYATLAAGLTLPPALLEKYLAAADRALEVVFTPKQKGELHRGYKLVASVSPGPGVAERDAARRSLETFLPRAFRRPVTSAEIDRYLSLYDRARTKGEPFAGGLRWAARAALVSPYFLLRIEGEQPGTALAARVSDHELAGRLAYFLWGTMPDEDLLTVANQGKLSDPTVLATQTRRLLADRRGQALTTDFLARWAQLDKLATARPSTEFFPTFNGKLRQAMHDEVFLFLDGLRKEDRSLLDVLQADYTYLNQELARHYGIPGVDGPELRKVPLKPEWHRGGLATMAATLTATSHTSRTSPTLRGKWVLDVLLGTPPPPPPPEAGQIDENNSRGATPANFRELLAQHASRPTCASCHRRIDPLGFGLENFDAVGRWRDGGQPATLDASGELPSGDRFVGPDELKRVLGKRTDKIVRNLIEQTLIFALGRELEASDEPTVVALAVRLKSHEYRFSELILGVVESQPFQYRRTRKMP